MTTERSLLAGVLYSEQKVDAFPRAVAEMIAELELAVIAVGRIRRVPGRSEEEVDANAAR